MYENDYMYAVERDENALAHYGIKGMKWGVRKAIQSGNQRALGRQYRKAQRKLARLEKRANNGKKYARRAAMLGAGAAAAGGLAALGTGGVANAIGKGGFAAGRAMRGVGEGMRTAGNSIARFGARHGSKALGNAGIAISTAGRGLRNPSNELIRNAGRAGVAVSKWGKSNSLGQAINANMNRASKMVTGKNNFSIRPVAGISNNTIARIGAGAVGAGLAGAAGYNAYRAATTKRAARKAAEFRKAMNESFRGTQYASGGNRQGKKRRRR